MLNECLLYFRLQLLETRFSLPFVGTEYAPPVLHAIFEQLVPFCL
jgi:hypothetical protein